MPKNTVLETCFHSSSHVSYKLDDAHARICVIEGGCEALRWRFSFLKALNYPNESFGAFHSLVKANLIVSPFSSLSVVVAIKMFSLEMHQNHEASIVSDAPDTFCRDFHRPIEQFCDLEGCKQLEISTLTFGGPSSCIVFPSLSGINSY